VRQILINLIGNAVKFTETGEILVRVEEEQPADPHDSPDVARLHFSVRDTGIGIPADRQQKIFEAFSQADGSTTRKYGGTGLGLTICSRLVELMGGRIWVQSESGGGSTFHFTLSMKIQNTAGARPRPVRPEDLGQVQVLIVDDNFTNRQLLNTMLSRWGMRPTAVESGRLALEALELARGSGHPFSLALLDAHMPELDGFSVAKQIRNNPELHGTMLMMLTSGGSPGDGARCRELGISAYLPKPIRQAELLEGISRVLQKLPEKQVPLITKYTLREERNRVRILLAEDNLVNQTVAVRLLEKRGFTVVVAGNGRAALAALEHDNFDLVLMDVQMPELDGFETTTAIRAKERLTGAHVPILAMTAHALKGDKERCIAAGMDGYLSKPIRVEELLASVESHLPPSLSLGIEKEAEPRTNGATAGGRL